MPKIDFKEIPESYISSGEQDQFELFARDFVSHILKFKIISEPNRGPDGGKDFLAEEIQKGVLSDHKITWLISCKHKAHTGNSVNPSDEENITDRIKQHKANGFIGFYSTITSSGLNNRLDSYKEEYDIQIFDKEKIESFLLKQNGLSLMKRYFPESYRSISNIDPSPYLDRYYPIECSACSKDLLLPENRKKGIIIFVYDKEFHNVVDVFAVCKGECDREIESNIRAKGKITGWTDIGDMIIPAVFTKKIMAFLNQIYNNHPLYSPESFDKLKKMFIAVAQFVYREQTSDEYERVKALSEIPDFF